MQDKINQDNTYTITLTHKELQYLENLGDSYVDSGTGVDEAFDADEQKLYDRLSGARIELEVHQGTEALKP